MFAVFWVTTIAMALLAFSFIATPLLRSNRRLGLVGVALALPIFAGGLYWLVGSPQAATLGAVESMATSAPGNRPGNPSKSVGSVASMIDGLAARVEENPDDGKSWLLLARSYKHLNRTSDAVIAYERAAALGEYDEGLAALSPDNTADHTSAAQIFGNVKLSDRSKAIVLPTDTVFIFARAVTGPPMPVAVLQSPVSALPLDFLLNDSQAISADTKLSNYEQVVVTARISRSGVASEALQDLEARSGNIVVADNEHLNLIIE